MDSECAATGWAQFAGREAREVVECVDIGTAPERLHGGLWFVVAEFDGPACAWRFAEVSPAVGVTSESVDPPASGRTDFPFPQTPAVSSSFPVALGPWRGPRADSWVSSLDRQAYEAAVQRVRTGIKAGELYQANICRVLSAPLDVRGGTAIGSEPDAAGLVSVLAAGNPAPYASAIHVPGHNVAGVPPVWVVSASPELFLSLQAGDARHTVVVESGPIKGTAATPDGLTDKDRAENLMITDLVRNDLSQVCAPGTVAVTDLLKVEEHPGLVHLVSRIQGCLHDPSSSTLWADLLTATFPPGSVSGAPKSAALRIIRELEPTPRGPYCGAVGWVDGDTGRAELAVGIRTFWWRDGTLHFGTGAGITYDSDPAAEWAETELKARRLIALASDSAATRAN